jgi:hypothetical protein
MIVPSELTQLKNNLGDFVYTGCGNVSAYERAVDA